MSIDKSVSKRINVTLPDSVVDELEDWANAQGRSVANLAAFLLEMAIKEAKDKGEREQREKVGFSVGDRPSHLKAIDWLRVRN